MYDESNSARWAAERELKRLKARMHVWQLPYECEFMLIKNVFKGLVQEDQLQMYSINQMKNAFSKEPQLTWISQENLRRAREKWEGRYEAAYSSTFNDPKVKRFIKHIKKERGLSVHPDVDLSTIERDTNLVYSDDGPKLEACRNLIRFIRAGREIKTNKIGA